MAASEFQEAYDFPQSERGELLATPISDLLRRAPITVNVDQPVVDAVDAMNEHHTGCVLVEHEGQLAGIFTERDVLTRVVFRTDGPLLPVEAVMTPDPETVSEDATIAYALNLMSVGGYRHIPVIGIGGHPVGVLSVRDIVNFLVEVYPEAVLNLPPTFAKGIADSIDGG